MKKTMILFATLALCPLSFAATLNSIDKDQVKQAFVNKTFSSASKYELDDQVITDVFTGSMDDQGNIHGKFAHKPPQGPQEDQGVYTIKDDGQLCITWQHWQGHKEFCVYTYNTENAYILVGVNNRFHIVFLKDDIK